MRMHSATLVTCALATMLAGCGPGPIRPSASTAALPPVQAAFEASGRLSAKHGTEGVAANFQWRHASDRDELELVSPLGQTIAMLSGDGAKVRLEASDGRVLSADSWTKLTRDGLGWPLPVEGLKYWIQGAPRADSPFTTEAGDDGRVAARRDAG